jgi:hypothetical protein
MTNSIDVVFFNSYLLVFSLFHIKVPFDYAIL